MKKLFIFSADFKCLNGLYFGGEIILYIIFGPLWGLDSISFTLIWQMLLVSVIITLLQYVFFVWDLFRNVSKFKKMVIYYFTLVALEASFIKVFNWFDLRNIKNIGISLGIFTILFLLICWSFHLYYKVTGEEYNEKLKLYKESKKVTN